MTFSQHVVHARQLLCFTQPELAQALSVAAQTVSNWECGRNAPWPKHQQYWIDKLRDMTRNLKHDRIGDRI